MPKTKIKGGMMNSFNRKGQVTLSAIIEFVIVIIMYVAIYPSFNQILQEHMTSSNTINVIINLAPILLFIMIIVGFAWYVFPRREVIQ